jgi:hypothetical protein
MKRYRSIIFICLLAVCACQPSTARQQAKSKFFENFNLYDTINRMNNSSLKCAGSFSTDVSGGGGEVTSYRKAASLDCEIVSQAGKGFDEMTFRAG